MKHLLLIFFCCIFFNSSSQQKFHKNEIQLSMGLNTQSAWEIEFGYSFLFHKNIGLTVALNMMDQMFEYFFSRYEDDLYELWEIRRKMGYKSALLFRPALRFRVPLLKESEEDIFVFNIEPGLLCDLSFPPNNQAAHRRGPAWLFSQVKAYLTLDLDSWLFSAGVGMSDFDLNYKDNLLLDQSTRRKILQVSFFALFSYRF